ncbi:BTB/POZ domain-containing protein 2 [Portunus trituberculatus]|uniref:BTB/POZ domain-containing protein 2 n=1 Tax=Portunus trituberculatus TaxID=210409 RepID=A0A5B7EVR1_PORTR|nr:BTB/POZ domain-containing protein 2 [Portunus trituberculatus]
MPVTGANQRKLLGPALSLVRFPLMTVEEFAQGPAQSGILTDREVVQLFLHFTVNPKPPVNFLDIPRCCMTGKEQTVCRFQQIESRWGYSGTSDRIRFIVDRRIFVVGFGMYGSIHGPSEYEVTIQIIHTATGKGPDSHYGTKGVRKVAVECPSGDRATFQFTYAAGNNNGTRPFPDVPPSAPVTVPTGGLHCTASGESAPSVPSVFTFLLTLHHQAQVKRNKQRLVGSLQTKVLILTLKG